MNNPLQQQHARPLSTATMQHPGAIRTTEHLMHFLHANKGSHVPVWLHKNLASQIIAQHAPSGMAIAHPGVPMPMSPPQMQQPPQGQPQGYAMGGVINPPPQIGPVNDNTQGGVSGGLAERKGPPQRQPFSRPGLGGLAVGRGGAGLGGVPAIAPRPPGGPNFLGPPVRVVPPEPGDSGNASNGFLPPPPIGPINDGGQSQVGSFLTNDPGQQPIPTDSGGGNPVIDPSLNPRSALNANSAGQDPNIDPALLAPGSQAWLMQQKFGGGPPVQGLSKGGMVKKKNDHDADDKPRKKTKKK